MIHAEAQLPPDLSRRSPSRPVRAPGWLARLTFVLCGLIVIFMAVHGDEHGRRPRFVWQSSEQTVKAAMLEALDPSARRPAAVTPPSIFFSLAPAALFRAPTGLSPVRPAAFVHPARAAAYLNPFANGPPSRI